MQRIGVIGGGLAGLAVAFRRLAKGDEIVLLESAGRLGGQLWTERTSGFVVEHGAEGFVARSEAVPALATALGIGDDLIGQSETRSYGYDGTGLRALAPGEAATFLGFQVPKEELGKGIRTFRRGMAQLAEALGVAIADRADVRRDARVATIDPIANRWRITLAGGAAEDVDAVVVATGAVAAARILEGAFGEAARALLAAKTASSVTVTLAYARDAIAHPLDATGFVVAEGHQEHGLRASTFITSKFPDRAPTDHVSLRLFFRPTSDDLAALDDAAWTARAEAGLARVLPVSGRPLHAWVSRWADALPVFEPRHVEHVKALEAALAGSGVILSGSAFHGSGIDAAVRSAESASRALDA
ncbi:Protoporphyrinogen IX oxidase, aerobic, HemY [Minicystis rosea]|nr:Protoporphyrinogen IX oxidase, aerobic, HemY [Minicystis rosea]